MPTIVIDKGKVNLYTEDEADDVVVSAYGITGKMGELIYDVDIEGKHFDAVLPLLTESEEGLLKPCIICFPNRERPKYDDDKFNYADKERIIYYIYIPE